MRLPVDLAAAQIHDTRSQVPTRAEAALPLLWPALLRRGPTRSSCCYCGLGAPRRSRRTEQVPTRAKAALPLLWRPLLRRGPTWSCCCYAVWALPADLATQSRSRQALRLPSRCYGGPCFGEAPRAVAAATRNDGIWCVTLLTDLPAARIYRTNMSRHYRVMVVGNAHHSTPTGLVPFFVLFTCLPVLHVPSPSPLRIVAAYIHLPSSSFVCFWVFWVHQHLLKGLLFCYRWRA